MFPGRFDYVRAESVGEALDLLAEHGDRDAQLLAGGHSLVPEMKADEADPDVVIDLDVPALEGLSVRDDSTVIGALTTYSELAASDALRERAPVVAEAAGEVADVQIRNAGTIGGNLVRAHPGADLPPAALAADATVLLRGPDGEREVSTAEFFRGDGETAVGEREVVTGVRVPHAGDAGGAYAKKTHPATGYALVGVAAVVRAEDGQIADARVAGGGAVDRAVRLPSVEDALVGEPADASAAAPAAERAGDDLNRSRLRSDHHASGEFRTHLLASYAERALATAIDRA